MTKILDSHGLNIYDEKLKEYIDINYGFGKSDEKPTEDSSLSTIVFCSNPTAGGYVGWVFTNNGWLGFGQIGMPSESFLLSDGEPLYLNDGSVLQYTDS